MKVTRGHIKVERASVNRSKSSDSPGNLGNLFPVESGSNLLSSQGGSLFIENQTNEDRSDEEGYSWFRKLFVMRY